MSKLEHRAARIAKSLSIEVPLVIAEPIESVVGMLFLGNDLQKLTGIFVLSLYHESVIVFRLNKDVLLMLIDFVNKGKSLLVNPEENLQYSEALHADFVVHLTKLAAFKPLSLEPDPTFEVVDIDLLAEFRLRANERSGKVTLN